MKTSNALCCVLIFVFCFGLCGCRGKNAAEPYSHAQDTPRTVAKLCISGRVICIGDRRITIISGNDSWNVNMGASVDISHIDIGDFLKINAIKLSNGQIESSSILATSHPKSNNLDSGPIALDAAKGPKEPAPRLEPPKPAPTVVIVKPSVINKIVAPPIVKNASKTVERRRLHTGTVIQIDNEEITIDTDDFTVMHFPPLKLSFYQDTTVFDGRPDTARIGCKMAYFCIHKGVVECDSDGNYPGGMEKLDIQSIKVGDVVAVSWSSTQSKVYSILILAERQVAGQNTKELTAK